MQIPATQGGRDRGHRKTPEWVTPREVLIHEREMIGLDQDVTNPEEEAVSAGICSLVSAMSRHDWESPVAPWFSSRGPFRAHDETVENDVDWALERLRGPPGKTASGRKEDMNAPFRLSA